MSSNSSGSELEGGYTINGKTFSILCPSRGRPKNLRRLLNSIRETTADLKRIEVLVYLDDDDSLTSPQDFGEYEFATFFRGSRVWMSLAQNILYSKSTGMLVMACADDFVFRSAGWDLQISRVFMTKSDPFWLVFGNDLGSHAGKIPTHFFLHRSWPSTLGYWVNTGRASLWDLWVYDVAKSIERVHYVEETVFEHLNFRQSKSREVIVDDTTLEITRTHANFRPKETYRLLERERRIDALLLSEAIGSIPLVTLKYVIGELIARLFFSNREDKTMRLRTLTNKSLLKLVFSKLLSPRS